MLESETNQMWVGQVTRRDQESVGRKTLEMGPPVKRRRGKPKQRCMNGSPDEPFQPRHESYRDAPLSGQHNTFDMPDSTGWGRIVSAAATPQLRRLE